MKGFIFSEFLEMVSDVFSPEMVEKIIEQSELPTDGAYTDVGTYDHQEMIRLITSLHKNTGLPIKDLEIAYGKYLFTKLLQRYAKLINKTQSTFDFLQQIDNHVHVEVHKLYPDAELPHFQCKLLNPQTMTMIYTSSRPFADVAHGLIQGCAEYFKEKINIKSTPLKTTKQNENCVQFTLEKQD